MAAAGLPCCGTSGTGGPVADASDGSPATMPDDAAVDGAKGAAASDAREEPGAEASPDSSGVPPGSSDAAIDAPPGEGGECTQPGDCHLFSSTCVTCACLALAGSNPTCVGDQVECFVDPCNAKTAGCSQGRCVVQP
jgi:hypothetical protein